MANDCRSVVERGRLLHPRSGRPGCAGDGGEVGVVPVGAVGEDPGRLYLQLDQRQSGVVEHDHLDPEVLLGKRDQLTEQDCQPAVARQGDDLPPPLGRSRADGVRQRVRHAPRRSRFPRWRRADRRFGTIRTLPIVMAMAHRLSSSARHSCRKAEERWACISADIEPLGRSARRGL